MAFDLQKMLSSLGDPIPNESGDIPEQIAILTGEHINGSAEDHPSAKTGRNVECVCATLGPIMRLAPEADMQDQLLWSLVFVGAVVTARNTGRGGVSFHCDICPATIKSAIDTYQRFTGKDIAPFLPLNLVRWANGEMQVGSYHHTHS